MQIKEIMTPQVEYIHPDTTIKEAAAKMKQLNVGIMPVEENDRLVGMITDRDIAIRSSAEGQDPKTQKVRDVMTKKVVYCYEDDSVEQVGKLMQEHQIRRLIILNRNKRLVGICSLGDLALTAQNQLSGEVLEKVSEH